IDVEQLRGEARRAVEAPEVPPGAGAIARLLLQLARRSDRVVLDGPVGMPIERARRDLEERLADRVAPLPDEEHLAVGIDGDHRDGAGMARDVARRSAAIRQLDGVDSEFENPAAAE